MAAKAEVKDLLEAGVHFGHLTRKWNPNMAPYIYMERNGIHVINLYKTVAKMEEACEALKKISASGRKILFVATKKQAKDIVSKKVSEVNMPYITERWPGGMLTNFVTIRKAVKKMTSIDRMKKDGTFNTLSKKERLQVERLRAKLEKNLGSIADMTRLPGALFIVDTMREHIAVKEAQKLNIPIFAMVDTNSDPRPIDFIIPANDDASKSIEIIMEFVTKAIAEGLADRKSDKIEDKEADEEEDDILTEDGLEDDGDDDLSDDESDSEETVADLDSEDDDDDVPMQKIPSKAKKPSTQDLTKIEGIGPKTAELLIKAGIGTYAALADATAEQIQEILTAAGSAFAHLNPASWPKQAVMAASGSWDELKEWQDNVRGGVE